MKLGIHGKRSNILFLKFLCMLMALTGVAGFGGQKVEAQTSSLITSYKPQAVSGNVTASYFDSAGNKITATFHHPGIVMSLADLDNMRDHVRVGDEPWNTAFNAFASDRRASKAPPIYYQQGNDIFVNIRGPWVTTVGGVYYSNPSEYVGQRANTDSETAFMQAIMWYITGDEAYRSNAMKIIRNYSDIQSCAQHVNFRFATVSYFLSAAAEIMRYSDTPTGTLKWTETDTANLIQAMNFVSNTYNPHSFFMNQHQFSVMGTIGRAIFANDLEMYAEAVEATTVNSSGQQGGRNGSIKYQMRWMTANEVTGVPLAQSQYHAQLMEMGRDVGHAYANVAGLSTLVQTIYTQGTKVDPVTGKMSTTTNAVNPFNFLNDRLLAGTTYILQYHLGYDVMYTPAFSDGSSYYNVINPDQRGRIDSFYSVLYNYYKYIEHQDMTQEKFKYLAYVYETRLPEVAGKDYPLAMLLYTPNAAKNVGLSNQITLESIVGLAAKASGSNTINLNWTNVSRALGYNIYRSTEENGTYTKLNSVPVTTNAYSSGGLQPNTRYYYKVGVAGGGTSSVISTITGSN
ncbi:fibronectin type III domain-containing protein [Paenibacillus donghaensis]|uniref:Fibronectin type-III domain-containing protein n=1 Tax=Paenibacillus donghaensis TaxID=414771 RepID=A0A2Z2KUM9_9BACL|nr:fibronectin type III domain-containing protein [Paenibacillus donghaensis]ASA23478.1 hypothetical protein B9T62_23335 [Paenibacillus donghaensis]